MGEFVDCMFVCLYVCRWQGRLEEAVAAFRESLR